MTYRIGGQVVDQGAGVADQPVFVVDTADADPTNWTVEAATTTAADGSWSVVVPSGNVERYHAVTQVDDSGTLKNSESQPYLTAHPELRPARVDIQFNVPAPQSIGQAIPDNEVSRDPDTNTVSTSTATGIRFSSTVEWPKIGIEISSNTSGVTRARLYNNDTDTLLKTETFAGLSAGETFAIEEKIEKDTNYDILMDAEGDSYSQGNRDGNNAPHTSSDGQLTIETAVATESRISGSSVDMTNIITIGDVGF